MRRVQGFSRAKREFVERSRTPTAEETAQALREFPDNIRAAAARSIELMNRRHDREAAARSAARVSA